MQSHWKKTHRLRVSQANQGCGHPTSTPRLLWSPSLLNSSEPLSESSPTLVLPSCHLHFWCSLPHKAQRTGSEDICKGPERQSRPQRPGEGEGWGESCVSNSSLLILGYHWAVSGTAGHKCCSIPTMCYYFSSCIILSLDPLM